mmetsp:Transcript_45286/g.107386  ORF Transcript_45286/g.107386 Transcript_45286/m.107386 type:complete len:486 (-) Transcript_45286:107-1564(-)
MRQSSAARYGVFCALVVAALASAGPAVPHVAPNKKMGIRRELSTVDLTKDLAAPMDLCTPQPNPPPATSAPALWTPAPSVFRANSFNDCDLRTGAPRSAPLRRETSQADIRELTTPPTEPKAPPPLRDPETVAAEQDLKKQVRKSHGIVVGEVSEEEVRKWQEGIHYTGQVLGVGGFSVVHAAKNEVTGTKYAVKVVKIPPDNACFVRRLIREVRLLQELKHPHIIELNHVTEAPNTCHLFMEHCTGGELLGLMEHMEFSADGVRSLVFEDLNGGAPLEFGEAQVVHLLEQVLLAVKHCHDRNIVHRDIKMENVLLCQPWQAGERHVKLADFGFATVLEPNERLTSACGSPHYCSPELLAGSKPGAPGYRLEADMWAVGVVAYSLLFCQYPFDGETDADVVRAVSKGAFEFGDHVKISAEAQDFVTSLLQVDYAKRLTIDAALVHPWITTNLAAGKAHAHATRQAVLMPHGVKEKARPAPWLPMR